MDKFLETYNLLLFNEEMENLNRPVTSKEIELVNKNLSIERSPGPDGFTVVQLLNCVRLLVTPWTAAHQASLSVTISQSLLQFMSIELVLLSNHVILCHPLLHLLLIFPNISVFPVSQLCASDGQSIRASASVLPVIFRVDFLMAQW